MKLQLLICLEILIFLIVRVESENDLWNHKCADGQFCVRLCCNATSPKSDCFDLNLLSNEKELSENYTILYGKLKCVTSDEDDDDWIFTKTGELKFEGYSHIHHEYCFEKYGTGFKIKYCLDSSDSDDINNVKNLYSYLVIVSIPFLIATILVYAFIKQLRNLHGKCLMCYCFSLVLLYSSIVAIHFSPDMIMEIQFKWLCKSVGYIMYTSVFMCFLWLNVMCHDVWTTFRSNCGVKRTDRRRFINYCIYAFGLPTLISLIVFIIDETSVLPDKYSIGMGKTNCFVDKRVIYLFVPAAIVISLNIVFYAVTAHKIYTVQKEISWVKKGENGCNSKIDTNKARFFLYLRLFVMMGVIWIVDLISFVLKNSFIFYVMDILNCLQGVLIFFLFIWKPKVKNLLVNRFSSSRLTFDTQNKRRNSSRTDSSTLSRAYTTQMSNATSTRLNSIARQNSDIVSVTNLINEN